LNVEIHSAAKLSFATYFTTFRKLFINFMPSFLGKYSANFFA
jgi:hypothetical protein